MNTQQAVATQPPAQPAVAAATTPAAPAGTEQMFDVQYRDGIRKEPLSVLQQRAVALSDAERSVVERNQRIVQLEQQNAALQGKARMADELNAQLIRDPDGFVAQAERLARMAKGEATPEDKAAVGRGHAPQNMEILDQLRADLEHLKQQNAGSQKASELRTALESYPLFANNETARKIAETTLGAMHAANLDAPIHELASKIHTQMNELISGSTKVQFENRIERQQNMPPAPAGQTPGMTAPQPPPTLKELRNGTLGKRMRAFMAGPNGLPTQG